MIPILSSIIVKASQNETMNAKKGFFMSLIYVLAMSVAYTIAGVIAGIFEQTYKRLYKILMYW